MPKSLKSIGFALFDLDEKGNEADDDWDDENDQKKREAAEARKLELNEQFEKLSIADRKKIFGALAPEIADWLEAAWQFLKMVPYQVGYVRKAFRAPKNPEVTLASRIQWIRSFATATSEFQTSALTLPWLASWAQHAFQYQADCVVPVLIAAMNTKGKAGDEVFDILYKTVTREHSIGIMGDHVIQSLLGANREAGWEIIEKTLLAAQRQEGLRQSILQNADMAHPQAFQRLLRIVLDKDLIRFSSVARAINGWFGLLWDSVSAKVLTEKRRVGFENVSFGRGAKKSPIGKRV